MTTLPSSQPKGWRKIILTAFIFAVIVAAGVAIYTTLGIMRVAREQAAKKETAVVYPTYPSVKVGKGAHAQLVKRGEYLVKAGDCIACHTAPVKGAKAFAGNYPVATPFGTIYTPNLTRDNDTGLGHWTEADFFKAMREVLNEGILHAGTTLGTTSMNYYSVAGRAGRNKDNLRVFRRTGQPCPECERPIERIVVSQRSSHFCPNCQPLKEGPHPRPLSQ